MKNNIKITTWRIKSQLRCTLILSGKRKHGSRYYISLENLQRNTLLLIGMKILGRLIIFIIHEGVCLGFNPEFIYSKVQTLIQDNSFKFLTSVTAKKRTILYVKEERVPWRYWKIHRKTNFISNNAWFI